MDTGLFWSVSLCLLKFLQDHIWICKASKRYFEVLFFCFLDEVYKTINFFGVNLVLRVDLFEKE
jgi:hypothetical protein